MQTYRSNRGFPRGGDFFFVEIVTPGGKSTIHTRNIVFRKSIYVVVVSSPAGGGDPVECFEAEKVMGRGVGPFFLGGGTPIAR